MKDLDELQERCRPVIGYLTDWDHITREHYLGAMSSERIMQGLKGLNHLEEVFLEELSHRIKWLEV